MNLIELLKSSDKTALIQGNKRITYADLLSDGLRLGGRLRNEGVGLGNNVLIFVPLSIELYTALIGVWSVGASAIFIDFSRGARFISDSLDRLKPEIIVCDNITGLLRNIYSKMRRIPAINHTERGDPASTNLVTNEQPAILTFTSGSTGFPKIAVRTHGFLINQYNALRNHLDFNENHIDLGTLPVFTLANLASNITTLLPDKSYRSKIDSAKLSKQMNREGVTRAICSPALMANLLKHGGLPHLKTAYLGGGPVFPSILEKIRNDVDLHIVYGSTEAEPISSVRWSDVSLEDRQNIASGGGLLVGQIVPEIECRIGEGKEILVSGETVLSGYLGGIGDDENKIRTGGKIWHRTGDAGYIDSLNRLWLLGRVSQTINDEAGTLYPFCVDCILDSHFGIRGAIIVQNRERVLVIEKGSARPDKVLGVLALQKIFRIVEIKKIPMDNRHGAKVDYDKLKNIVRMD